MQKSRFKGDWFEIAGSPTNVQSAATDIAVLAQQVWFIRVNFLSK